MELEDYPGYLIYSDGEIWSKQTNKYLKKGVLQKKRYYKVTLYCNGVVHKDKLVHRLVAMAYLPNPNHYQQVNHINKNKSDNRVENLEWCTNLYNTQSIRRNTAWGCISDQTKNRSGWRFVLEEMGNRHIMMFKTREEAEEYREITKLLYEGLMLN